LTVTLCLLAFGIVMVFSASSTTSLLGSGDGFYYLKRTLIFGGLGLIAMRMLDVGGAKWVRPLTGVLVVVSFGMLLAVHMPGLGVQVNGASRWIGVGPLQIQPSEIAKLAIVLYGANLLAERPAIVTELRTLVPYLGLVGLAGLLIVVEPDLGTAIVLAGSVAVLLIAAGIPFRLLALVGGSVTFMTLVATIAQPYRMARLTSFLHPAADASGAGFQGIQASIALGSGGILGVGLGESVQKAYYLPEAHTDMIGAVIGEELGLVGIVLLVALFGLFGYAGFRTAQRCRDRYGKLLAAGITGMILVQAVINLFAVLGLAPLTGIPLPFVSYGNSSLMVTLAAVGLLLNVASGRSKTARLRVVDGGRGAARASSSSGRTRSTTSRSTASGANRGHSRRRDGRARRAGARRSRRAAS
jgi:cell division protein FtsW